MLSVSRLLEGNVCFQVILWPTFNSSCDEQETVFVMFAQVPRVQPALVVQSLFRLLRHIQIPH